MLFVIMASVFLIVLCSLIWLFVLDFQWGLAGLTLLVACILSFIFWAKSKTSKIEKEEIGEFCQHIKEFGAKADLHDIHLEIIRKYGIESIYGVNNKFRESRASGQEELKLVLRSLGL